MRCGGLWGRSTSGTRRRISWTGARKVPRDGHRGPGIARVSLGLRRREVPVVIDVGTVLLAGMRCARKVSTRAMATPGMFLDGMRTESTDGERDLRGESMEGMG